MTRAWSVTRTVVATLAVGMLLAACGGDAGPRQVLPGSPTAAEVPSSRCDTGTKALDGYVGDLYTKVAFSGSGADTKVCLRLDKAGTAPAHFGASIQVPALAAPKIEDLARGISACAADGAVQIIENSHSVSSGVLGQVKATVGLYALAGMNPELRACALTTSTAPNTSADAVAVGQLIRIPLGQIAGTVTDALQKLVDEDGPNVTAESAPTPTPSTLASAFCQNGSSPVRILNMSLAGERVWLYALSATDATHLCVRAQGAAESAGGRFQVKKAEGEPLISSGTCDANVIALGDKLVVKRTQSLARPAVCVTIAGTTVPVTLGEVNVPSVEWMDDAT